MSRPASELTGQKPRDVLKGPGGSVSVRWTNAHHIKFLQLGGSRWLRETITQKLKEDQCANQTSKHTS